jgi:hypothetical protein
MTVVGTPRFLREAAAALTEEERIELVSYLAANPEAGDVMPETGGARKLRWKARGRGRSGGGGTSVPINAPFNGVVQIYSLLKTDTSFRMSRYSASTHDRMLQGPSPFDPSALRVISMKLPFPGCLPLR